MKELNSNEIKEISGAISGARTCVCNDGFSIIDFFQNPHRANS